MCERPSCSTTLLTLEMVHFCFSYSNHTWFSFSLHFPNVEWQSIFSCSIFHSHLFGKASVWIFYPFFSKIRKCVFLLLSCERPFHILYISSFLVNNLQVFSPSLLLFSLTFKEKFLFEWSSTYQFFLLCSYMLCSKKSFITYVHTDFPFFL